MTRANEIELYLESNTKDEVDRANRYSHQSLITIRIDGRNIVHLILHGCMAEFSFLFIGLVYASSRKILAVQPMTKFIS